MGRYIQWTDITARYHEFPKTFDSIKADTALIPQAEAEVDGRLAAKYTVPFTPAPYLVQDLSIDLAYYKMIFGSDRAEALKTYIDDRFRSIIDGTLVLTTSAGAVGQTGVYAWASNSYHTSFGPDSEINWQVSSQWIDDVQSARE